MNNKKERIKKLLTDRFKGIFDKDLARYLDMVDNYSLDELKEHFKENDLRVHVIDDLSQAKIDQFKKRCGLVVEERLKLPYKSHGLSGVLTSDKKAGIYPMQARRLQQKISSESAATYNTSVRNKYNQVVRESKTSSITDVEVGILTSLDADAILTELMSSRSDNKYAEEEMNRELMEKQTYSLKNMPTDEKGKTSLTSLNWYYIGSNMCTDFVGDIDDFIY